MTDATIADAPQANINSPYEKVLIALLAGFTPIILKYVSRDPSQAMSLLNFTYLWTGLALSVVGFIALYMTSEKSRMKLFAMAVSAPAVFSNMTAQTTTPAEAQTHQEASAAQSANPITAISNYIGDANNELPKYYRVIVFSSANVESARNLANTINASHPDLKARVRDRRGENDFFGVYVGDILEVHEARALAARVNRLIVDDDNGPKGYGLSQNNFIQPYDLEECLRVRTS